MKGDSRGEYCCTSAVKIMRIKKKFLIRVLVLFSFFGIFSLLMFVYMGQRYLAIADNLSLTFSRSMDSFGNTNGNIYVFNNSIYFLDNSIRPKALPVIKRINGNRIETVAELPEEYESVFFIVNDEFAIVQKNSKIYLLDIQNKRTNYLANGKGVGVNKNFLYYLYNYSLYAMDIFTGNSQVLFVYDEVLSVYSDGIIFKCGEKRYSWTIMQSEIIVPLPDSEISWPKADLWIEEYLYTNERIFRITKDALDVYTYETGEVRRLFALNESHSENIVVMAVCVSEKDLFISRQLTDIKFWPIKNKEINGTFQYDFDADKWFKIDQKAYLPIIQFDSQYLYGLNHYSLINFNNLKQIKINKKTLLPGG